MKMALYTGGVSLKKVGVRAHAVLERCKPIRSFISILSKNMFCNSFFQTSPSHIKKINVYSPHFVYGFLFVNFIDFSSIFIPRHDTTVVYTF